jgi:CcmD family protein
MRLVRRLLLVLVLSLAAAPRADAQGGSAPAGAPPVASPVAPETGRVVSAGLPQRAAPPRTLRDHWHVFVAFALAWVLLFGYVVSLGRRFARVERDLRRLGGDSAD